jgi:hypothetical protein
MTTHIESWTDGYLAVRYRAFETRGFIELDTGVRWPRTTGEDVIAIAALFDQAIKTHGTIGISARWAVALSEMESEAIHAPHRTYSGNRSFWSALEQVAVFLDDIAVPPPHDGVWSTLIAAVGSHTARNVGPSGDTPFKHFDNVRTFDELYNAQYKYMLEQRGSDEMDAPPLDESSYGTFGTKKKIPRTTNADVVLLAGYWGKQLADVKEIFGHESIEKKWDLLMKDVGKLAMYQNPTAVYPQNNKFWRCLGDTAIHIAVADEAPSKWDMAKDSIKDSIKHLPENLGHGASKAADLVASAAHAVGKVANEAGKGLFEGFGTPLLIGAGLIGLFLITRSSGGNKEA